MFIKGPFLDLLHAASCCLALYDLQPFFFVVANGHEVANIDLKYLYGRIALSHNELSCTRKLIDQGSYQSAAMDEFRLEFASHNIPAYSSFCRIFLQF